MHDRESSQANLVGLEKTYKGTTMERLIKHVLDTLADLGESEQVALFSVAEETPGVGVVAGGFVSGEFVMPGGHVDFTDTPLEEVIALQKPGTFPGTLRDGLPFPVYEDDGSNIECLCLPLLAEEQQGAVLGVAVLAQQVGISPPDYRMQTLTMLRTLISAAIENARLFQLATMDGLTGLYVRRYFEIRLQEEIQRILRYGQHSSLVMLDIDHFKRINDTYGHQQGDRVLESLGQLLLDSIRHDIDLPCRYGGEEFLLLLPNTPLEGARVLAERIRARCAELAFTTTQGNLLNFTISIGIAEINQENRLNKEELIRRADLMLYAAKQAGRNRVMVYREDQASPKMIHA